MSRIPVGYNLAVDVSYHQVIDYATVSRYIKAAILRVAFGTTPDSAFLRHYEGFMSQGIPCAAYAWFRPDQDVKAQIEVARNLLINTKINLMLSDQEQHGIYSSTAPGYSMAPFFNPGNLSELCESHVTGLRTHGFEMGTYTRSTWVFDYCRPSIIADSNYPYANQWRYDYPIWLASWPFAQGGVSLTWDALINSWAPTIFSPYYKSGWPTSIKYAHIWQWSGDKFILPGIKNTQGIARAVDLNYVSDTIIAKFMKSDIPVPIPPPTTCEDTLTDVRMDLSAVLIKMDELKRLAQNMLNYL